MSSHHVIRDEQEPPVFILDETLNVDLLKQLLGWSPSIWVMESVAEWAMSLDIKIDGILTTEPGKHQVIQQQSGQYSLVTISSDKILFAITQLLTGKLYTGIHIFCNTAQRDEILKEVKSSYMNLPITLLNDFETIRVVKKQKLRKWYPAGTQLQVLEGALCNIGNFKKEGSYYVLENDGIVQVNAVDSTIILKEI